ncbi:MAG: starch-binding protein [Flavobacteriales bacterium]|nr:starch-binding protein [Flavobacteriales bacterium]
MKNMKLYLILIVAFSLGMVSYAQDEPSSYYQTNPTFGSRVSSAITIDGNPAEWTEDMLIVQGVANDDARAFRGPHEAPVYDLYQLYAAWDDTNLYLMWQITNVADVVSPEQGYPNSDNGKPWNGDIPFQIALDIDPSTGTNAMLSGQTVEGTKDSHIWGVYNLFDNSEVDKLLMFSSKPNVGVPGLFSLNASGAFDYVNVEGFADAGISYMWGDYSVPASIYGINSDQHRGLTVADLGNESKYVDFNTLGHNKAQDTVYEMVIPLASLGIDSATLESDGIGVMLVSTFGQSGINSLPYDFATFDNAQEPYSSDESSSMEKEDVDHFSANFARIGKSSGVVVTKPKLTVSPVGGTYIGGTEVTLSATGDNTPIKIHYTLDGTTPSSASPFVNSGETVQIPATNTTLKAVAIDANDVSSYVATHVYKTEENNGIRIGFKNTNGWENVYIYAWQEGVPNILGGWPGTPMTALGNDWFEYVFEAGQNPVNIVINDNQNVEKTDDILGITTDTCYDATSSVITCEQLSVETLTSSSLGITIYPNPASEVLNITSDNSIDTYAIYNLTGKLIKKSALENNQIDVSALKLGNYILVLQSENQKETIKFIKK